MLIAIVVAVVVMKRMYGLMGEYICDDSSAAIEVVTPITSSSALKRDVRSYFLFDGFVGFRKLSGWK